MTTRRSKHTYTRARADGGQCQAVIHVAGCGPLSLSATPAPITALFMNLSTVDLLGRGEGLGFGGRRHKFVCLENPAVRNGGRPKDDPRLPLSPFEPCSPVSGELLSARGAEPWRSEVTALLRRRHWTVECVMAVFFVFFCFFCNAFAALCSGPSVVPPPGTSTCA